MPACEIRRMTLDDLDAVVAIEAATFPTPWSRHSFEQELTRNVAAGYLVAALDAALWAIYGRGDAKAYAQACQDAARQAGWTVEDSVCTVEIPATEKLSLRVQATLLPFTEEAARLQLTGFATVSQSEEMEAFF